MKTKEEILQGCEHDGSYIPVNEVKRLMYEYAEQFKKQVMIDLIKELIDVGIVDEDDIDIDCWVNNYIKSKPT